MRILIVEDEEMVARRLERLLREILADRPFTLRRAASVAAALEGVAGGAIDLLLLDLNLSGRSGFQVLREAVSRSFQTIIVSAHEEQAIRAFEHGVTDFVPKPFSEARLRKALDRYFERDGSIRESLRYLAVRRAGQLRTIRIDEVVYLQGAGDYAELHCRDGSTHLHDKSLTELEGLLPARFLRVHRSYVANLAYIELLRNEPGARYSLRLTTGEEIPVGRTRVAALRERLV
jgi:DNA-binding LytR/AlgR family response regulator